MIAYLPCELKSRDLDPRILIAAHLVNEGVEVILGNLWGIVSNIERPGACPPGVALFATTNKIQARMMGTVKAAGHRVLATNEEALAISHEPILLSTFTREAVENADLLLFQNKDHEKLVTRAFSGCRGAVVGNARIDLIQNAPAIYRDELKITTGPGPYILFNTTFPMINSIWGSDDEYRDFASKGGVWESPYAAGELSSYIEEQKVAYQAMLAVIDWMKRELKGYRLVIRPHPAENANMWREIPGVEIVDKSMAIPWILGASLLVHANSTTGIEAALLGVPTINLGQSHLYLMSSANFAETDSSRAIDAIKQFLSSGDGPLKRFKPRSFHYPKGAAARIAEKMIALGKHQPPSQLTAWGAVQRPDQLRDKITVSQEEFFARARPIIELIPGLKVGIQQIDDTMFRMRRQ